MNVGGNRNLAVPIGKYYVAIEPITLTCIGLGSCLAIALYDPDRGIGSMAHTMLPNYSEGLDKENPGKYTDIAIYLMVDELTELGAWKGGLKAKIAGGAQMFQSFDGEGLDIGMRNVDAAIETLEKEGIALVSKHVGGSRGRNIWFDVRTGVIDLQMGRDEIIRI